MRCSWILYALLTTVAAPALAADDWVVIGESTSDDEYAIKSGTGQIALDGAGKVLMGFSRDTRKNAPQNSNNSFGAMT